VGGNALEDFATRYTAAWCSQDAARVAAFFSEHGSLKINGKAPAVGRAAVTAAVQSFMSAFPDLLVRMDKLDVGAVRSRYQWTLTGTHGTPAATAKSVRISGYEDWRLGTDGLIAESLGHFDEVDYERQLSAAAGAP